LAFASLVLLFKDDIARTPFEDQAEVHRKAIPRVISASEDPKRRKYEFIGTFRSSGMVDRKWLKEYLTRLR